VRVAAVVTDGGGVLGTEEFPTTAAGYRRLLRWMRTFGRLDRVGVEGTGTYGVSLARHWSWSSSSTLGAGWGGRAKGPAALIGPAGDVVQQPDVSHDQCGHWRRKVGAKTDLPYPGSADPQEFHQFTHAHQVEPGGRRRRRIIVHTPNYIDHY